MTSVILPFLMPMLLGRTINLRNYQIGAGLYDYGIYNESPLDVLNSTYHVLQDDSYPYSFFQIPIDVALRIKSDYVSTRSGVMGVTGLLKDTSWKYNSVVVGMVTIRETSKRTLKEDAELLPDWKNRVPRDQTHYARSFSYGAWAAVLFKFHCDIPGDVQAVRKSLTEVLGVSGKVNSDTAGLWKKALQAVKDNKDIRGQVKITTTVYSTFQLPAAISSIEDYLEMVADFPKIMPSPGQPLYMTLEPLSALDRDYDEVEGNNGLKSELEKMDDMFDDVKITKESLVKWTTETTALFSDQDEERIYSLLEKINSCIRSFSRVNEDVSLFKQMDRASLELAFHQYIRGLDKGMGTYNLQYLKLREEIDAQCDNDFLHKIRGLLKVSDEEKIKKGKVEGGLQECQKYCVEDAKCRAVGYAEHISELDITTGMYFRELKQCWIYYRSSNTAYIHTPNGLNGDMGVYDRKCYLQ